MLKRARRTDLWVLAALVPPAALLAAIARLAVNVPYWDDWRWADMVVKFDTHRLTFGDLWHPEVEHRILLPSLEALGLSRLGGYSTVVESFFSWGCTFALLGCLYVLLRRTLPPAAVGLVLLVQSVLLFSLAQLTTYLWGFQLAWTSVNLLALVVLVSLCGKRLGPLEFLSALIAALAASISSAQGLMVLAIGLLAIATRRPFPGRAALAWTGAAVAAIFLILPGLSLAHPGTGVSLASQFLRAAMFPIVLGAPVAGWSGTTGAFVAGLFALWRAVTAASEYVALVRKHAPETLRWTPWIALTFFGICGSLMIALGRGVLGPEYGLQERYITLASVAWIGLVPLAIFQFARLSADGLRRARVPILLAVAVLAFALLNEYVSTVPSALAAHERRFAQFELVRSYARWDDQTLIIELFPNEWARAFMRETHFPSPDDVRGLIAGLEANGEGPFRR